MAPAPEPALADPSGDDWVGCSAGTIDVAAAANWVVRPDCGAVVTFAGTVRDHAGDRTGVHLLEYEAYLEQTDRVLADVAGELRRRWSDVGRIVLWHRVGALVPTEVAVVVAVSSAHRDGAFEAARWAIDEVKATAPIWKREHHDGGVDWGRCDHRSAAGAVAS